MASQWRRKHLDPCTFEVEKFANLKAARTRNRPDTVGRERVCPLLRTQLRMSEQRKIARIASWHIRQRPAHILFTAATSHPYCRKAGRHGRARKCDEADRG
jgi:hypothetical protein